LVGPELQIESKLAISIFLALMTWKSFVPR